MVMLWGEVFAPEVRYNPRHPPWVECPPPVQRPDRPCKMVVFDFRLSSGAKPFGSLCLAKSKVSNFSRSSYF